MASPLQLEAGKLPPVPRAGFAAGGEAEGGRAPARYVHKIGTSSKALAFMGSSVEGEDFYRREKRDKLTRLVVNSLNRCGREKQAKALATCGEWFDVWVHPNGDRKAVPCFCDSMFCPECANRRSRPLIKKLSTMLNRPGRSYWFLTLTVPNTEDISRRNISEISEQFAELWKSWVFQKVEDETGKPFRIYGGVRSIECTRNLELKSWHPHIHVLFEASRRLPGWWLTLLKAAWIRITGDARYLHLQRAYTVTRRGKEKYNHLNVKALREVCKYVTKCAEFAGDHLLLDEFCRAFKCVRRIQCFGSFYDAQPEEFEREPGDDSQPDPEVCMRLRDQGYRRIGLRAALSETEMSHGGSRQFCFAFHQKIDEYLAVHGPPWELMPSPVVASGQKRIEFAGAMPGKSAWQPALFEGAA
jgi:plasmid rolling circle replication initiator protein Rep